MQVRELEPVGQDEADVLIVEDNSAIAELYALKLRMDGLRVQHAVDAATAHVLYEQTRPSVVCVDVRLPDASGAEAAPHFAEGGSSVILLTNDQEGYEQPPSCVALSMLKSRTSPSELSAAVQRLLPEGRRVRPNWPNPNATPWGAA